MKLIFLDFDGVMDTAYYNHILGKEGRLGNAEFEIVFDPNCGVPEMVELLVLRVVVNIIKTTKKYGQWLTPSARIYGMLLN